MRALSRLATEHLDYVSRCLTTHIVYSSWDESNAR
jgi:hypothetical protein